MSVAPITASESLGRSVHSSRASRIARKRDEIVPEVFVGEDPISVDRLSLGDVQGIATLAKARGRERTPPRGFYGWAELKVSDAEREGRTVRATPTEENAFHADIHLNLEVERGDERWRGEQKAHAIQLARRAAWREGPDDESSRTG